MASAGGGEEVNLERMEWDLRARNWQELIERCSGRERKRRLRRKSEEHHLRSHDTLRKCRSTAAVRRARMKVAR